MMSLEEFLLVGGGCGFVILVLRALLTGRYVGAGAAVLTFLAAYTPFLPKIWDVITISVIELIIASVVAVVSLLYVQRGLAAVLFVAAAFAYIAPHLMLGSFKAAFSPLVFLAIYIPMIALLSPPVFVALASIYFVDIFDGHRIWTTPRNQGHGPNRRLRG